MINFFEKNNFLSDKELLLLDYLCKKPSSYISKNNKTLLLYQINQNIPETIKEKISLIIGSFDIVRAQIYELEQPYRIHNDSGRDINTKNTFIIPLDLSPQGGVYVFDQWAENFSFSLDNYYHTENSYNKLLKFKDRKNIINLYDESKKLPDTVAFSHIKNLDKIGFTIKKYFKFEFNKLVMFPSKNFHCSENVVNFSSKKSLVLFTR
jgi:hypothetical protein